MKNQWKHINRCVICGGKLKFEQSESRDAKPEEGVKACAHNHGRFAIMGFYDALGNWDYRYYYPVSSK